MQNAECICLRGEITRREPYRKYKHSAVHDVEQAGLLILSIRILWVQTFLLTKGVFSEVGTVIVWLTSTV